MAMSLMALMGLLANRRHAVYRSRQQNTIALQMGWLPWRGRIKLWHALTIMDHTKELWVDGWKL